MLICHFIKPKTCMIMRSFEYKEEPKFICPVASQLVMFCHTGMWFQFKSSAILFQCKIRVYKLNFFALIKENSIRSTMSRYSMRQLTVSFNILHVNQVTKTVNLYVCDLILENRPSCHFSSYFGEIYNNFKYSSHCNPLVDTPDIATVQLTGTASSLLTSVL